MNTQTRLLNRTAVRDYTFAVLKDKRPHLAEKLTRISGSYYLQMEARLINAINDHISHHPSVGATIR